jgi:L-aminopeptidase/D-esterase-like protein
MSLRAGARNLITDVDGVRVGNAADARVRSGVTVVLPDERAVASCDVRGGAPGTRETELLAPASMMDAIDALVLSGGSAYGLDAATGAMLWLAERGRGFRLGSRVIPIVPAAILYDLDNGGEKDWSQGLPYQALGRAACAAAGEDFDLGTAGAGYGAKAGALKGGLGSASVVDSDGLQVGALVAVNARGHVTLGEGPQFWAWPLEQEAEFGGLPPPAERVSLEPPRRGTAQLAQNTTLGVVATNLALDKAEAQRVAIMAQDGLARAIRPLHTPFDGDSVFALSTARLTMAGERAALVERVGALAADCLSRAVARGVYLAESLPGMVPSWRQRFG